MRQNILILPPFWSKFSPAALICRKTMQIVTFSTCIGPISVFMGVYYGKFSPAALNCAFFGKFHSFDFCSVTPLTRWHTESHEVTRSHTKAQSDLKTIWNYADYCAEHVSCEIPDNTLPNSLVNNARLVTSSCALLKRDWCSFCLSTFCWCKNTWWSTPASSSSILKYSQIFCSNGSLDSLSLALGRPS